MIDFLTKHFRYSDYDRIDSSSYAVNIKIQEVNIGTVARTQCYEMIEVENYLDESGFMAQLQNFFSKQEYRYRIVLDGRSGGYAVLRRIFRKKTDHKSRCKFCQALNFDVATEKKNQCGMCNKPGRVNLISPVYENIFENGGMDTERDFEDWTLEALRKRVLLVWTFDLAVERACHSFVDWAMTHRVEERTIQIPQSIKISVPM